ncbi:MAG: hypothetical protein AB7I42_20780 [Bradyrhizobium sp.]|uniref:hypothetical protein n=1 Tax=Bradyrhizobium sp. TaxID=376 RepID=UPI003D101B82
MINSTFDCYVMPDDRNVVFVGLRNWIERGDSPIPMIGVYLSSESDVNERFDVLEAELRRCRRDALAKVRAIQRETAPWMVRKSPEAGSGIS